METHKLNTNIFDKTIKQMHLDTNDWTHTIRHPHTFSWWKALVLESIIQCAFRY